VWLTLDELHREEQDRKHTQRLGALKRR